MARPKKGDNNPATPRPHQGRKARAAAGRGKNKTATDHGKGADALRSERDRLTAEGLPSPQGDERPEQRRQLKEAKKNWKE
jgi:hypothetical protein